EFHHLRLGRDLQIDAGPGRLDQELHVPVLDVTPILAKVDRDAIRAAQLDEHGGANRIRLIRPPRLTDGRNVIDVDVESHYSKDRSASSSAARWASSPTARASSSA